MKALLEKYKWLRFLIGAALIALGIVTIIIALDKPSDIRRVLCVTWAVFCFIAGGFAILAELLGNPRSPFLGTFVSAGLTIGFGIFLCWENGDVAAGVLLTLLTYLLPWVLVAVGGALLLKAVFLLANGIRGLAPFFVLATGTTLLVVGLIIWFCKNDMEKFIYVTLGVLITVSGVLQLANAITRKK